MSSWSFAERASVPRVLGFGTDQLLLSVVDKPPAPFNNS